MKGFVPTIYGKASRDRTLTTNRLGSSDRVYAAEAKTVFSVGGEPNARSSGRLIAFGVRSAYSARSCASSGGVAGGLALLVAIGLLLWYLL